MGLQIVAVRLGAMHSAILLYWGQLDLRAVPTAFGKGIALERLPWPHRWVNFMVFGPNFSCSCWRSQTN